MFFSPLYYDLNVSSTNRADAISALSTNKETHTMLVFKRMTEYWPCANRYSEYECLSLPTSLLSGDYYYLHFLLEKLGTVRQVQ